jgi:hypothetical protein
MGLVKFATAFLAAAAVGRAALDLEAATAVPGAYIVEYEDDAVVRTVQFSTSSDPQNSHQLRV